jgi:hypothetical protein
VKVRKLIFGMVAFLFIFVIFSGSIQAEPVIPAPNTPLVLTTPPVALPSAQAIKNDSLPGQNQVPVQNIPIQQPSIPQIGKEAPVAPIPGNPNQPGFDPNTLQGTPPIPAAPQEVPVKKYQTSWYTSFWFLSTMVLLLVVVLLVIYSLKEGKPPSEEKEEMIVSKKKKNNKK